MYLCMTLERQQHRDTYAKQARRIQETMDNQRDGKRKVP